MGNDTSRAIGTDFQQNVKTRDMDVAAEDLPSIPFSKAKAIQEELETVLKSSIFFHNYKRAFRGYLRLRPERNQTGALFRIQTNCFRDADLLGLPKDIYYEVVDVLIIRFAPQLYDDFIAFLIDRKKLSPSDDDAVKRREAERCLGIVLKHLCDTFVQQQAKKLYEKYSRGEDFEMSDVEIDPETKAKQQALRQEKLRKAAEERQRQALEFQKQAAEEEALQTAREAEIARRVEQQKAIKDATLI